MERLNIKTTTWLQSNLSWAEVIYNLINAFDDLGHNTYVMSTNGLTESAFKRKNKMIDSILGLQSFGPGKQAIDLDFTFTVPQNFPARFLANSRNKAAIYAYEYPFWTKHWRQFYHLATHYFPPSNFGAEVFINNGVPANKTYVVPHGVDVEKFNPAIPPIKLKTHKAFKFVSVVAPHSRKRIGEMLKAYAQAFTAQDNVCLVLKTKLYRKNDQRQGYEICVGEYLNELIKRHGPSMPEIEVIDQRVDNVASIYTAAQVHISTTGSEAFGIPFLEAMSCGLFNIATNYSGHLDFLNANNSLLINYKLTPARKEDQYWGFDARNKIAQVDLNHTSELMLKAYHEYDALLERFRPAMKQTVEQYSWVKAAQRMLDVCDGKVAHYIPGTVKVPK